MTATRSYRRRLLTCALVALSVLLASGGTASATLRLDTSSDTSDWISWNVNWFSGTQQPLSIDDRYQYFAYWADDGVLTIAVRQHGDGRVRTQRLTSEVMPIISDYTNIIGFGISPHDGRRHISYRDASGNHRYLIGNGGCLPPNCSFTGTAYQVDRTAEVTMHDPQYFNDSQGNLYFTWRNGASSAGDQVLNTYNDDTRWTHRGVILSGTNGTRYTFDPDEGGPAGSITSGSRWPIVDDFVFGKNDRLHVTWSWREHTTATPANQHGTCYAYSDDYGATWRDSAGRQIATTRTDPITLADSSSQVLDEPPGVYIGTANLAIDAHNQPHLAKSVSAVQTDDPLVTEQRQAHYWRTVDGRWYGRFIEASGDASNHPTSGSLFFDRGDNAYLIFARNKLGWAPWNSNPQYQEELPVRNVTWANGTYMNVRLHSSETALRTEDYVGTPISLAGSSVILVRMRNDTSARDVRIYWTTDASPTFRAERGQTFRGVLNANDPNYTSYSFTITDADWTGTLRQLEVYPADGASSGRVSIDYIKIRRRGTVIDSKVWEFDAGKTVMAAEASPADNWGSWNVEPLLSEVADGMGDTAWGVDQFVLDYTNTYVQFPVLEEGGGLSMRKFRIPDAAAIDWTFDKDSIGWSPVRSVSGFAWVNEGGVRGITGTVSGAGPALQSMNNLDLDETERYLHVRMSRSRVGGTFDRARAWFVTESAPTTWYSREISLSGSPTGYATYTFDMHSGTGTTQWREQTIRRIEFEPADVRNERFTVDRIWIDGRP